jgi:hypothetical protein
MIGDETKYDILYVHSTYAQKKTFVHTKMFVINNFSERIAARGIVQTNVTMQICIASHKS